MIIETKTIIISDGWRHPAPGSVAAAQRSDLQLQSGVRRQLLQTHDRLHRHQEQAGRLLRGAHRADPPARLRRDLHEARRAQVTAAGASNIQSTVAFLASSCHGLLGNYQLEGINVTSFLRYLKLPFCKNLHFNANANFSAKFIFSLQGVLLINFHHRNAIAIWLSDRNNPDKMVRPETVSGVDSVDTFLVRSRAERMKEVHGASGETRDTILVLCSAPSVPQPVFTITETQMQKS